MQERITTCSDLRVRISCFLSGNQTHHINKTGSDTKGQNCADVVSDFVEASDESIANPNSSSDWLCNLTLGSIQPTGQAPKGNDRNGFWDIDALTKVESSSSIVLGEDEKDWDKSNDRIRKVPSDLVESQPGKANTSKWHQHGSDREELHHEFTKESQEDVDETGQKVCCNTHLPGRGDAIDFFGFSANFIDTLVGEENAVDDSIAQSQTVVTGSITVFQRDRALLHRDRAKKMYGVLPYFFAKMASDMTNNTALPFCYGAVVYWTCGLRPGMVPFLRYLLVFYLSLTSAQSMGFFMSVLIPQMNMALLLAPSVTLFQFILAGFYIPIANLHVGIQWASYSSFALYGYSALMLNEFDGREIPCADDGEVPISFGSSTECPLPGEFVYESVGIQGIFQNYWFHVGVLIMFQIFYLVGAYALLLRPSKG